MSGSKQLLTRASFESLSELLRSGIGLHLSPDMEFLIISRLEPLCKEFGVQDIQELIVLLESGQEPSLETRVFEAMSTHESYFFRDGKPFDALRDWILPRIRAGKSPDRTLTLWSAACSTGQEIYSIGMILKEDALQWQDWNIRLVASDHSRSVLERACAGVFSSFDLNRGLDPGRVARHFEEVGPDQWRVLPEIRNRIEFYRHNLLDPPFLGEVDVVFLRNVLIYFEPALKARILDSIADAVSPEGYLILGGAETPYGLSSVWEGVSGAEFSVYQRRR